MGNLLKYLVISLFCVLFSGTDGNAGSQAMENSMDDLCGEYMQYQHSIFEPATSVYVNINESSFSTTNTIRVQKKNKRSSGNGRFHSNVMKSGKAFSNELNFNLIHSNYYYSPSLSEHFLLFLKLGRLII